MVNIHVKICLFSFYLLAFFLICYPLKKINVHYYLSIIIVLFCFGHDETPKMGQTLLSTWNPWAKIELVYTKAIAFIHSSAIEYFPSFPVSDKLVKTIGMYYYCLHRSVLFFSFGAQRRFWLAWMKQNIHRNHFSESSQFSPCLLDRLIKKQGFYFQIIFDLIFLDWGELWVQPLYFVQCTVSDQKV